jgi:hypothetical protein
MTDYGYWLLPQIASLHMNIHSQNAVTTVVIT